MKRIVGLILILVLSLSLIATATAEYNDEIRFQGLPWGTSFDLVSPLYTRFDEKVDTGTATSLNKLAKSNAEPDFTLVNEGQMRRLSYYSSDYVMHIGPYDCNSIDLYFAYIPQADGSLVYDSSNTSLYAAQYYFSKSIAAYSIKNAGEMLDTLIEKLNLLYGEYDSYEEIPWKDYNENAQTGMAYTWKGANDTEVVLYSPYGRGKGEYYYGVYLTYYTKNGDQLLKNADAAADPDSATYKRLFLNCNGL